MENEKNIAIAYVYDVLCGWCYGFTPVMKKLQDEFESEHPIEVISGGMILGDRVGPIGDHLDNARQAFKMVEERTGVRFGKDFVQKGLTKGDMVFNSMPPSKALAVFRQHRPGQSLAFASGLQKGIYGQGHAPEDLDWYGDLAAEFGLDARQFRTEMEQPDAEKLAQRDFQMAQALQVQGFPAVFAYQDNRYAPIARGYIPYPSLKTNLKAAVEALLGQTA